jgi:hypothetical protein
MKLPDKIRLYIGKCDIKNGKREDANECAISLAVRRKFPKTRVVTTHAWIHINHIMYNTCNIAKNFISNYDKKRPVKPTKIILTKVK